MSVCVCARARARVLGVVVHDSETECHAKKWDRGRGTRDRGMIMRHMITFVVVVSVTSFRVCGRPACLSLFLCFLLILFCGVVAVDNIL